jgi:phosphoglycolate phosphatase-like HAD superfamily hydrolase
VVNEVIKCPYIDGSLEFLEINYKKIPIFLASATPSGELIEIINKRSMTHFFRGIYGSPMSKSEIITYIIDINKYNKMDVLMVGDSNADEVGASKAGVDFIKISRDSVKSFDTVSSVI